MVFSSTIFLFAFLPVVLLGYYLLDRRFKNIFLLLASLFFYAWGEPRFVLVMMGSILVNHLFALLIDRTRTQEEEELGQHSTAAWYRGRARFYLTLTVIFNLALFFVYKYLDFAITNLNAVGSVFKMPELPLQGIALPIGISFFTFQAMSYVFDVYSRRGKVQKNPLNTALYVALFPQLIAGPIVRYEMVANEINTRQETLSDFAEGIRRFILGLAKKVILSNNVAIIADQAFGITDFSELSVAFAWLGAVSYTLQIYFDFSGYSDMAIGLGLMFGFHFNENFDYPYCSKSISEFWRRWHISLGSWFRDYVYIPLGGSRVESKSRHIFYFVLLVIEKVYHLPERFNGKVALYSYQAFTLLAVVIGWVLFRANGLKAAFGYLCSILGLAGNTFSDAAAVFLIKQSAVLFGIAILFCTPVVPKFRKAATGVFGMAFRMAGIVLYLLLFLVAVSFTVTSTYNPFIYFNF